jgi:hypothetical protein
MKIRYSEFHPDPSLRNVINDTLPRHRALAAIDSGLAIEIPYASAQERLRSETPWAFESVTATVQWSVTLGSMNQRYAISAKCSRPNCQTFSYDGSPAGVRERIGIDHNMTMPERLVPLEDQTFNHSCGCQNSERIPAAIAAQYRSTFKPVTQLGADEAVAAHMSRPQPSKPVDLSKITGPTTGPERAGSEQTDKMQFLPSPDQGKHVDPSTYMRPVKNGK